MWQFFVCYSSVFTALLLQQYFLQQCFYSSILCGITALLKYCITALLCGSDLQQCCTAVYYCIIMFYSIIFTAVFLQQKWYLVLTLTPGSKNIAYILGLGVAAERVSRILILHQVEKYIIYPGIWFTAEMVSRIFILHQEEC